jgi:hypothetical protein
VKREARWKPGSADWRKDKKLISFFAQCLDRPAFRTYFHQELSFSAFDQAMEDTIVALNTGYWKMREGTLIKRAEGKACIINPDWRGNLDKITGLIEDIRRKFTDQFGFNEMLFHLRGPRHLHHKELESFMEDFRGDRDLGNWMDKKRQEAIDIMNSILEEVGMQPLRGLRG